MLIETKLITSSDNNFLKNLFFEIKSDIFQKMPKEILCSLLNLQFKSQQQHYYLHWPKAEHYLLIFNKAPIGQVIINKSDDNIHIVDISILPSLQKQGIGTQYLLSLIAAAKEKKLSINLSVDKNNPVLTLYKRIGFKVISDDEIYYKMEIEYSLKNNFK
jgi:ribosomal protein S18 acetylase RimI-like enzyme